VGNGRRLTGRSLVTTQRSDRGTPKGATGPTLRSRATHGRRRGERPLRPLFVPSSDPPEQAEALLSEPKGPGAAPLENWLITMSLAPL
jgi:hypothetical protein